MTRLQVVTTGGTIANEPKEGGTSPEKRGEELVAAVPELSEYAELSVREVAQVGSYEMDFETWRTMADAVRDADEFDAVVVTHGTDTMEESAYFLDLTLDVDVPVVFTGAQRRFDEVSPDGPSNMVTAVRAAVHDRVRDASGTYVAFDQELHHARYVTKRHTSKLGSFVSPERGPVASATRNRLRFHRPPGSETPDLPLAVPDADVRMVKSAVGVGDEQIRNAVADGSDGIVVEATGLGNATRPIGNAVADAVEEGIPVVVTSRCFAGATSPLYGGDGGGEMLRRHGAIFAGDLPAHKARIKLAVALATVTDRKQLREYF